MDKNNYAIIMAGGIGSRFWPISVEEKPKQFLDVLGFGKTLIQLTYERLAGIIPKKNIYVVTNKNYVQLVKTQLPDLPEHQILSESERKNTAPTIAYSAFKIYSLNPNAILTVAPSDHLILKEDRFVDTLKTAIKHAAAKERIITLGIKPNRPDTSYGYIKFVQDEEITPGQICKVNHFIEKPSKEMAELFLRNGDYYWNSGIFIWKAETILNAIRKFKPKLYYLFNNDATVYNTLKEAEFINKAFQSSENISIDFAVMENAKNVDVILADFDWSDIGTWGSLFLHLNKDLNGNSIKGKNTYVFNSNDCLINIPDDKRAIVQGLNNYIVVDSKDGLLILDKKDEQSLKNYFKIIEN